jgi:hypothetical protein
MRALGSVAAAAHLADPLPERERQDDQREEAEPDHVSERRDSGEEQQEQCKLLERAHRPPVPEEKPHADRGEHVERQGQ